MNKNMEKGKLTVGVEHGGKTHKDFELRPQFVRDSVEILEGENAERAKKSDSFFGVCLLARQIKSLGSIPAEEITPEVVMSLTEIDFLVLNKAKEALETRLRSFRDEAAKP